MALSSLFACCPRVRVPVGEEAMHRYFIALALLSASSMAFAGKECEACGKEVQAKIAACQQSGGKDCNTRYKDDAVRCSQTCRAEADKARQQLPSPVPQAR